MLVNLPTSYTAERQQLPARTGYYRSPCRAVYCPPSERRQKAHHSDNLQVPPRSMDA
jgi:hypothetical protein